MTYTKEQIAENRQSWVDGLRSGNYKQGTGFLRPNEEEYCCMGVLWEVLGGEWTPTQLRDENNTEHPGYAIGVAPTVLYEHLKLSTLASVGIDEHIQKRLTSRNDGVCVPGYNDDESRRKWTFDEIADYLEELWAEE